MHSWEQIQITIEYIEEHLNEEICSADLAEKSGVIRVLLPEIVS